MRKHFKMYNAWPIPTRVMEGLSDREACDLEKELIALHGRIDLKTGCLFNLTDGGEGTAGRVLSMETKAKMSASRKGYKPTPESIAKRAVSMTEYKHSPETIEKMRLAHRGVKHSPETKAKISAIVRARRAVSAETRAKISAANKGKQWTAASYGRRTRKGVAVSEETKARISATLKKLRETIPPANKGMKDSPEVRERKIIASRLSFQIGNRVPWNKGIPVPLETLAKISCALKRGYAARKQISNSLSV
jgi:hypothetical protein